jgi:hypothetical protein
MSEILIQTFIDNTQNSIIAMEQALFLYDKGEVAVQINNRDNRDNIEYEIINKISEYKVDDNAKNIYFLNLNKHQVNINPKSYNILFINNYIKLRDTSIDKINKFEEIWVSDDNYLNYLDSKNIKNLKLVYPNFYFNEPEDLKIFNSNLNILCYFPENSDVEVSFFFRSYFKMNRFKEAKMVVVSDNNNIQNIIKKERVQTENFKINILSDKNPKYIDYCIMNCDLLILPYVNNQHWNIFAVKAAILSKPIVLTHYSNMAKYIKNSSIIMDLPNFFIEEQYENVFSIYNNFFENINLENKTNFTLKDDLFVNRRV